MALRAVETTTHRPTNYRPSWRHDEDLQRQYQAGYRAASIDDCDAADTLHRDEWMRGYHDHQRDRERVAQLAANPWCRKPLERGIFGE